jgi:hypothetical protein
VNSFGPGILYAWAERENISAMFNTNARDKENSYLPLYASYTTPGSEEAYAPGKPTRFVGTALPGPVT